MNYLKISNKGQLDLRLLSLIGGTTKDQDVSKIGQFGTGLKYSLSFLLRSGINFKLFIGTREIEVSINKDNIQGQDFDRIVIDGEPTSITTKYGNQWATWEMLREIWCNAVDEGSERRKVTTEGSIISGDLGRTTFFIEMTEEVKDVVDNWFEYFISEKPLFENDSIAIYKNKSDKMKVYKNGTLTKIYDHKSLFKYDFKTSDINELRQYMGYLPFDVSKALMVANRTVVQKFLYSLGKKEKFFENGLDFSNIHSWDYKPKSVKESFSGFLFLDPDSSGSNSSVSVKVPKNLFSILQSCGLPCERIYKSSGGSYYGSTSSKEIEYRRISDSVLSEKISKIMGSRNMVVSFDIVAPVNGSFDFITESNKVVFSSELDMYSDSDLQAIVMIACGVSLAGSSVYDITKRLLKLSLNNPNLRKILTAESKVKEINVVDVEDIFGF